MTKRIVQCKTALGVKFYIIETNRFLGIPVKWRRYNKTKYWSLDNARRAIGLPSRMEEIIERKIILEK